MYKLIAWMLPSSSVDTIVNALTKVAVKLAEEETRQISRVFEIESNIEFLEEQRRAAKAEAARAQRVASKLQEIVA